MNINSLLDLTVEDYLMIKALAGNSDEFIRKEMVRYFDLGKLSIQDSDMFMDNLTNILKQDPKFIQRFELDGIEYGFIPNLNKTTTAEWIDIDNYQKDEKDIHRLLSILYRPIVKKFNIFKIFNNKLYDIEKYKGTTEKLKKAPLEVYLGSMVFFYLLNKRLYQDLNTYIQKQRVKMIVGEKTLTIQQKLNLVKSLDGII